MHTCISSHRLKRSWRSCPRWVNAGNKNTPSTHHPRRRNVTTLMVGLKNGHIRKNLTQKWWTPEIQLGNAKKIKGKKRTARNQHQQQCCSFQQGCSWSSKDVHPKRKAMWLSALLDSRAWHPAQGLRPSKREDGKLANKCKYRGTQ